MKNYNLEQYRNGNYERTMLYNVPKGTCEALKKRLDIAPKLPGTVWEVKETINKK